jgi:predicted neuraminidase
VAVVVHEEALALHWHEMASSVPCELAVSFHEVSESQFYFQFFSACVIVTQIFPHLCSRQTSFAAVHVMKMQCGSEILLLLVFSAVSGLNVPIAQPSYDGVIRPTGDGREIAYMIPPFASSHASHVQPIVAGAGLAMVWFSGTKEGADNVSIVIAHLTTANSSAWSTAFVISRRPGYSNQNPVLHTSQDGSLHLFHSSQPASQGEDNASVWTAVAPDGIGAAPGMWSQPEEIFSKAGSFTKNRVLFALDNSTWLLPMYYATGPNDDQYSHIKTSNTLGQGPWGNLDFKDTSHLVQPTVIRSRSGYPRLTAFFRDRDAAHIYRATSDDDGKSWTSPAATPLPNNNAGIQACQLQDGRVAMVFNPTTKSRSLLAIALSEDEGLTWPHQRLLENETSGEFSYPTLFQDAVTRQLHVSYTFLRQTIKCAAGVSTDLRSP